MEPQLKRMKFVFNDKEFKYKFVTNQSYEEAMTKIIREEFNLSQKVKFSLIDINDNCVISYGYLPYLNDDSSIRIKIIDRRDLSTTVSCDM